MDTKDKKVLNIVTSNDSFEQVKNAVKKSECLEYNKHWKEKLMYPCGTIKKYDYVLLQNEDQIDNSAILLEFKGVNTLKEKKSWIKTKRYFEIELGNIVNEKGQKHR